MGLYATLPNDIQEVDVVIAGGGTAACVVASRLAAADPNLSILVIESGRDNYEVPTVTIPLLWRANYIPSNPRVYFHKASQEEQLSDRESIVQVGNTLGGGSSINLMMYVRAQKCDFDSWNTKGWTSDDMVPYAKKVSGGLYRAQEAEDDFIQAVNQVGYNEPVDLQDFQSVGVSRIQKYISPEGRRQDAAHTYLHPLLRDGQHPNLHVLVETQVVRVVFDGDRRASGVEFRPNTTFQLAENPKTTRLIAARKLVVVSSGTLGTPPILERSGVGDPEVLRRAGVPLVAELPGVGHDFQDHTVNLYPYKARLDPGSTADGVHDGSMGIAALLASGDEMLGWNGIDASSKLRPSPAEVKALGSDFEAAWNRDFRDSPSRPLVSMIFHAGLLGDRSQATVGSQYSTIAVYSAYPYSRGHIHITGGSVDDPLDFKTGYLTDRDDFDLKTHVWGYKKQREIARRMNIQQGEVLYRVPRFDAASPAATAFPSLGASSMMATAAADDVIPYNAVDEAAIVQWVRDTMTTCWHGIGTCKMAPREQRGVVNASLGVHGVRGLKVVDLSVVPENVCANTMSTALSVGEKPPISSSGSWVCSEAARE